MGDAVGMIAQVIPISTAAARAKMAFEALRRELSNITGKGALDPKAVCGWAEVRQTVPEAVVG